MTNKEMKQILLENRNNPCLTHTGEMFLRMPMKYWNRVKSLEEEWGLIDDCRFILTFKDGWVWGGYESVPVRSMTEAIRFVKESYEEYV